MVLKHGIYNKVNAINEYADNGVKVSCIKCVIPFSSSSLMPPRVPKVDTITSLAANPAIIATAACHVTNHNGAKIGAINLPIIPNALSADPYLTPNGNILKAHNIMEHARITVPAFFINPITFSPVCNNTPFSEGSLYDGSSIINGVVTPFSNILLRIDATINAIKIPKR